MKRFILTAAVLWVASSAALAQMPTKLSVTSPEMSRQADPAQLQMIKNVEANYMQSYNDKSAFHLKTPDIDRLNRQSTWNMKEQV